MRHEDMELQPYPAYKPSGVEWLGELPTHWSHRRLKFAAPASTAKLSEKPEDVRYLGLEHIESGTGRLLLGEPVEEVDSTVGVFQKGDVLFGKLRPYLAKVVHTEFDGVCTSELLPLRPISQVADGKFLFYLLLSTGFIALVTSMTYGAKMPRSSAEQIADIVVPLPPLPEQRTIAAFLDRETAKLDALIAKKERLIELLQEKRTALISRAVTKGLDPTVPMKDTGVPWLGEIPAQWKLRRLKTLNSFVTSGSRGWAQHYSDDGATFLRVGNLTRHSVYLDLSDVQHVEPPQNKEGDRTRVKENDVVISITAYVGSVAVVTEALGEAYVNQHIALTRPRLHEVDPRWLAYYLASPAGQLQFRILLYGGTKEGLGLDDVQSLVIIMPPHSEQVGIITHVEYETSRLEALIGKVREGIDKLREYRSALIAATVTGKIDVRNSAQQEVAE